MTVARERLALPALTLAPRLLGAVLISDIGGSEVALRLTEVEAYAGTSDPASHAYRGPTRRNAVMFGPAGYLYCYFTYGMHWCANVVCGDDGEAAAVLMRAGEVIAGIDAARERRTSSRAARDLAQGPARLATCLGLDGAANAVDLCDPASVVRLESMRARRHPNIASGPRVGIVAAADRPWRFWLAGDETVSTFKPGGRQRRSTTRQTESS